MKHYRLSPSKAKQHLACPASAYAPTTDTFVENEYTRRGTEKHSLLERWVLYGEEPEDEDDREVLQEAYDELRQKVEQSDEFLVEHTLQSQINPDHGGTPDYAFMLGAYASETEGVVEIHDLKAGTGVPVMAEGNPQLMSYASLLAERWGGAERFRLVIWQPWLNSGCDDYWVTREEVLEWRRSYYERMSPENADVFCEGDHCRWCNYRSSCPHLQKIAEDEAGAALEALDETATPNIGELIPRWLSLVEKKPAIMAAIQAAEKQLLDAAERGANIPGYELVAKLGNRKWNVPDAVLQSEFAKAGVPLSSVTKTEFLSPRKVESLGHEDLVNQFSTRPVTGKKLKRETPTEEVFD